MTQKVTLLTIGVFRGYSGDAGIPGTVTEWRFLKHVFYYATQRGCRGGMDSVVVLAG